MASYYADPLVRARIREFLGGGPGQRMTATFINANDPAQDYRTGPLALQELDRCLDEAKEIYRSLWDRQYLVANLDVEYVNLDDPGHPYLQYAEAHALQQPVVDTIEATLRRFGILPLRVLSGRGHHFTWNIRRDSAAFDQLNELGRVPATLAGKYAQPLPPHAESLEPALGHAFSGLGLVLEFLAHEVLDLALPISTMPVTLTAVETVSARGVRESVVLDLSEYGDPLHTRSVRVPYSVTYKPLQQEHALGPETVRQIPPLFLLPANNFGRQRALQMMRDPQAMAQAAQQVTARIPDHSAGTFALARAYQQSSLARIHDWYYAQEQEPPENWSHSYDITDLDLLPPSGRKILEEPNDLLLKPACLRHIVRLFLALGWHPRHIAGLVRSKFERNHGWGHAWYYYDATARADFYCRLFTGLILEELDELSDFNSPPVNRLRGFEANEDLTLLKEKLQKRIQHDRLASGPLHGLLL